MGYPVPASAPRISIEGNKYSVAAFLNPSPVGDLVFVGFYIEIAPGDWNEVYRYALYNGGLLEDVKVYGGIKGYVSAMIAAMNKFLRDKFSNVAPPISSVEPTTESEALTALIAEISTLKFTIVNGVPVLGR